MIGERIAEGGAALTISTLLAIANPGQVAAGEVEAEPNPAFTLVLDVPEGATLTGISETVNVPVDKLAKANGIDDPDLILTGQEIIIEIFFPEKFQIKPGMTLNEIADYVGVTPETLASINGIVDMDFIKADDVLALPREGQAPLTDDTDILSVTGDKVALSPGTVLGSNLAGQFETAIAAESTQTSGDDTTSSSTDSGDDESDRRKDVEFEDDEVGEEPDPDDMPSHLQTHEAEPDQPIETVGPDGLTEPQRAQIADELDVTAQPAAYAAEQINRNTSSEIIYPPGLRDLLSDEFFEVMSHPPSLDFAKANYDSQADDPDFGPRLPDIDVGLIAYFAGSQWQTEYNLAVAIAMGADVEAAGAPFVINSAAGRYSRMHPDTIAVGIFQMLDNPDWHHNPWDLRIRNPVANLDPVQNALHAYELWLRGGWDEWEAFTKGNHLGGPMNNAYGVIAEMRQMGLVIR